MSFENDADRDTDGYTPLLKALIHNEVERAGELIVAGADPSAFRNKGGEWYGYNALHIAVYQKQYEIVELICSMRHSNLQKALDAHIERSDGEYPGYTPLVMALVKNDVESNRIARELILAGADPSAFRNKRGEWYRYNALHIAVYQKQHEIVGLICNTVHPNRKKAIDACIDRLGGEYPGYTPLDIADAKSDRVARRMIRESLEALNGTRPKKFDVLINSSRKLTTEERETIEEKFHLKVAMLISVLDEKDEIVKTLCAPIKKYVKDLLNDEKITHPFGDNWYDIFVMAFVPSKFMIDESVRLRVKIILNLLEKIKEYQAEQTIVLLKDVFFAFEKASHDLDAQSVSRFIAELNTIVNEKNIILARYEVFKDAKIASYNKHAERLFVEGQYVEARDCYEKILKLNPEHSNALHRLGRIYQDGLGVDANEGEARRYYQQDATNNGYESIKQLLILDNPNLTTADQWCALGEDYYYGRADKTKDFLKSAACFEMALTLDANHVRSLYVLGWQYQYGQGVSIDLVKAKNYYEKAAKKEHFESSKQLLILDNPDLTTANQWDSLGEDYYYGRSGKSVDFFRARACYEQAIKLDPMHRNSLFSLGFIYEFAKDVDKDLAKARGYYEKAAKQKHFESGKRLLILDNPDLTTANQWDNLGEDYYYGRSGKSVDFFRARVCYEQAIERDPTQRNSFYKLGLLYEFAKDVDKDLAKARGYYEKAVHQKHLESSKRLLIVAKKQRKETERENLLNEFKNDPNNFLDKQDDKNDTALHRAAKEKRLKDVARLIILRARKDLRNGETKKPLKYLSSTEKNTMTELQGVITDLISNLKAEPIELLSSIVTFLDADVNADQKREMLRKLYQIDEVKPLMDLAKLAVIAWHNLSNRKKFKPDEDYDYDSDNDNKEELSDPQRLAIRFDAKSNNVDTIAHLGQDGQEGLDAYGVYTGRNSIYIGGARDTSSESRATMIHELTHFIAYEVFNNACKPYAVDDEVNRRQFARITDDLRSRNLILDPKTRKLILDPKLNPILRGVFENGYTPAQYQAELIVRVPQILVLYGRTEGLRILNEQAPELLAYYNDVFLKAVKEHTDKLQKRALSDWPLELFNLNNRTDYTPERSHDSISSSSDSDIEVSVSSSSPSPSPTPPSPPLSSSSLTSSNSPSPIAFLGTSLSSGVLSSKKVSTSTVDQTRPSSSPSSQTSDVRIPSQFATHSSFYKSSTSVATCQLLHPTPRKSTIPNPPQLKT